MKTAAVSAAVFSRFFHPLDVEYKQGIKVPYAGVKKPIRYGFCD
jgi:hypothetical protein